MVTMHFLYRSQSKDKIVSKHIQNMSLKTAENIKGKISRQNFIFTKVKCCHKEKSYLDANRKRLFAICFCLFYFCFHFFV